MTVTSWQRAGGLAFALGGLLRAVFVAIYFVFTHGSTQYARHERDRLFSMEGADWCRIEVLWPGLLLGGMILVFWPVASGLRRSGRLGFMLACAALVAELVALVLQCWLFHPDRDFESAWVVTGFVIGVLAYIPLAIGLILLGRSLSRARIFPPVPALLLIAGWLVVPTVVVAAVLQDWVSTGGRVWDLALTGTHLPLTLTLVWLGWVVWTGPGRSGEPRAEGI